MNTLKHFFSYQYLFDVNTVFISPKEKLFFMAGAVMVLLAIVLKIAAKLSKNPVDVKYRNKFYSLFLSIGIAEVIWYGARYENVRFFNTKFVAWSIVLIGIIWLVTILVKTFKNYGAEKTEWDKEQVKLKYLPK